MVFVQRFPLAAMIVEAIVIMIPITAAGNGMTENWIIIEKRYMSTIHAHVRAFVFIVSFFMDEILSAPSIQNTKCR